MNSTVTNAGAPVRRFKSSALTMVSLAALTAAAPGMIGTAYAQGTETVTVSASRIVRDGFQAPTPTTVLAAEDIAAQVFEVAYAAMQVNLAKEVNSLVPRLRREVRAFVT